MQNQEQTDKSPSPPTETADQQQDSTSPDGDELPTPSPKASKTNPRSSGGGSRNKSTKSSKSSKADHEFLESMTKTVSNLGDAFVQSQKNKNSGASVSNVDEDDHDLWAKILARKVRRMDQVVGDQFKIDVDIMALKILSNN